MRANPNLVDGNLIYRVVQDPNNGYMVVEGYEPQQAVGAWSVPMSSNGIYLFDRHGGVITSGLEMDVALKGLMYSYPIPPPPGGQVVFVTPYGRYTWDGRRIAHWLAMPDGFHTNPAHGAFEPGALHVAHVWRAGASTIRGNPGEPTIPDFDTHRRAYETFNSEDFNRASAFKREVRVPATMPLCGPMVAMMYRSKKWDGPHDYIHHSGPDVVICQVGFDGPPRTIPASVRNVETVAEIGERAIGYQYRDAAGVEHERALPSGTRWFWSERSRAFYAIKTYSTLVAVAFGGRMKVTRRGVVG